MFVTYRFSRGILAAMARGGLAALFAVSLAAAMVSAMLPARAAVFSDDPETIHDPRHPQSQTGADRMFAPIGLIWTNAPVPHELNGISTLLPDMATAFLVSPCYVLTNYHVVFGNRKSEPEADQDYSATFWVGGKKSRAVPVKHGRFYEIYWQDWVLLQLESDAEHRCIGEDPNIGWVRLVPLPSDVAPDKTLSIAGYPSDKAGPSLWRQDKCHLFEEQAGRQYRGLWTTDCATRPRASGSPIFSVQDGVLMVAALMQGHLGDVNGSEILPQWDPKRANLAVDMGKILSSDADILKLIAQDIDRYHQSDSGQAIPADTNQIMESNHLQAAQPGDVSDVAPAAPSDNIQAVQPPPSHDALKPGP